jgi:ankyrin repeat protein
LEICKYLVNKIDDKNPSDMNGWTPLHDAALEGSEKVCRLIMNKVENKRPLNTRGETPEDVAFRKGFGNIVELFYTHKEW